MGKIIVIEGTDGSGKQMQSTRLYEKLKAKGERVMLQSFPNYESICSGPVKMYLGGELSETANDINAYQASAMFAVDRLCTMLKLKEFLASGGTVILDRYVQSNMMHQAGKISDLTERDKFLEWLDEFEFGTLKLPRPDKVLFLNVPPEVSAKLREKRGIHKTGTAKDIHEHDPEHIINSYNAGLYVAKKFGWETIDCVTSKGELKSIEEIHNIICCHLGIND